MERQDIREGMKVRSSDGANLGKVVACGDETFIIEKGFFFPQDYSVRYGQVAEVRSGEIWLGQTGQELTSGAPASEREEEGEWGQRPPPEAPPEVERRAAAETGEQLDRSLGAPTYGNPDVDPSRRS